MSARAVFAPGCRELARLPGCLPPFAATTWGPLWARPRRRSSTVLAEPRDPVAGGCGSVQGPPAWRRPFAAAVGACCGPARRCGARPGLWSAAWGFPAAARQGALPHEVAGGGRAWAPARRPAPFARVAHETFCAAHGPRVSPPGPFRARSGWCSSRFGTGPKAATPRTPWSGGQAAAGAFGTPPASCGRNSAPRRIAPLAPVAPSATSGAVKSRARGCLLPTGGTTRPRCRTTSSRRGALPATAALSETPLSLHELIGHLLRYLPRSLTRVQGLPQLTGFPGRRIFSYRCNQSGVLAPPRGSALQRLRPVAC